MSAQHTHPRDWPTTPGRLEAIHGSTLVIEGTGERIGRCGDHGPHVANARRLAACWNACEGLNTDKLERMPAPFAQMLNVGFMELWEQYTTAKDQRDELLEALKQIIEMNRATARDKFGDSEQAERWACVIVARAAIAKATT